MTISSSTPHQLSSITFYYSSPHAYASDNKNREKKHAKSIKYIFNCLEHPTGRGRNVYFVESQTSPGITQVNSYIAMIVSPCMALVYRRGLPEQQALIAVVAAEPCCTGPTVLIGLET